MISAAAAFTGWLFIHANNQVFISAYPVFRSIQSFGRDAPLSLVATSTRPSLKPRRKPSPAPRRATLNSKSSARSISRWEMNPVKFPINSYELYFLAMISGILAYVVGSLLTQRTPCNLDRLLHRGIYDVAQENKAPFKWTLRNAAGKLIGITPEFTRGDKIISWSVFGYAIVCKFGLSFVAVLIWNLNSPWPV
jgi:hypothetical protein